MLQVLIILVFYILLHRFFINGGVGILDVQQTTSLRRLSLSILLDVPNKNSLQILGEITRLIRKERLNIDITILEGKVSLRDLDFKTFALTMLSGKIETKWFHDLVGVLSKYHINIERINQLAKGKLQCIEFIIALNKENLEKIDRIRQSARFKLLPKKDFRWPYSLRIFSDARKG